MARQPKFFMHISSTNLTADMPVTYEIRASTHHWNGVLLDDSWEVAEMEYNNIHETENALAHFKKSFLALQEISEPSKDKRSSFHLSFQEGTRSIILLDEDEEYYNAVQLATSKGWKWAEDYTENLVTGERRTMGGSKPYNISLSTWEWGGKAMGSSVGFSPLQREGESKADFLLRILETAEKAKQDFPDSIPYTNIYGEIKVDDFKTRIIFGN